jgi:hypothetical protein
MHEEIRRRTREGPERILGWSVHWQGVRFGRQRRGNPETGLDRSLNEWKKQAMPRWVTARWLDAAGVSYQA